MGGIVTYLGSPDAFCALCVFSPDSPLASDGGVTIRIGSARREAVPGVTVASDSIAESVPQSLSA